MESQDKLLKSQFSSAANSLANLYKNTIVLQEDAYKQGKFVILYDYNSNM